MPADFGADSLLGIKEALKPLEWHRNATDMAQAYGTHEQLALVRACMVHDLNWVEGVRSGAFNMTYTTPCSKTYKRLTVYNHVSRGPEGRVVKDRIGELIKLGADIANEPTYEVER